MKTGSAEAPIGHSRAAHAVHGWCSHCNGRTAADEVVAWRVRENNRTGYGDHDDPDGPPTAGEQVPLLGDLRHGWCPHCRALTLSMATISAVTDAGVTVIGGYAVCESCGWSPYAENRGLPG
ncbi:hypothetical protein [Planotetraspora sp. GP83]|uniref:hypothetical protein n=1 Tax=Planotetraspora sp. GP83 TaxID=3156264 RepID=UPI003513D8A1